MTTRVIREQVAAMRADAAEIVRRTVEEARRCYWPDWDRRVAAQ